MLDIVSYSRYWYKIKHVNNIISSWDGLVKREKANQEGNNGLVKHESWLNADRVEISKETRKRRVRRLLEKNNCNGKNRKQTVIAFTYFLVYFKYRFLVVCNFWKKFFLYKKIVNKDTSAVYLFKRIEV